MGRLSFLKYSGFAVAGSAIIIQSSCKKDDNNDEGVNLGSGDTGILNYAYALEQLEAAFYTKVITSAGFNAMPVSERNILADIQKHEVAHREFFKTALGSAAIQGLEVDFSSVDFNSRTSILNTAKAFEDLGVSAYNGAGNLIVKPEYLLLAGKIVSVEARHAAAIRSILNPGTNSFANSEVVNAQGLDGAKTPSEVLSVAGNYVKTKLNASNLPG